MHKLKNKKIIIISIIIILVLGILTYAFIKYQEAKEIEKLLVIKPQFDWAYGFSEGLACVEVNKKWGYVDKTGKMIIKPQFEFAGSFNNGLAEVQVNNKRGLINNKNQFVVYPQFDLIDSYYNFNEDLFAVRINNKWGFINAKGQFIVKPQYDGALPFSEGLAGIKLNNKWGYIDKTGKFVISPKFNEARSFTEGLAFVILSDEFIDPNKPIRHCYIDRTGKCVLIPEGTRFRAFSSGLAPAEKGGWGFINKKGTFVIPPKYWSVSQFSEGLANVNGIVSPYNPSTVIKDVNGFIDKKGNLLITIQGGCSLRPTYYFEESLAAMDNNKTWGFINKKGKWVIKPVFEGAQDFSDGLAAVQYKGKWGYIRKPNQKLSMQFFG